MVGIFTGIVMCMVAMLVRCVLWYGGSSDGMERRQSHVQPRLSEDFRRQAERSKKQMKEETMTLAQLKEYIRDMPGDAELFEEAFYEKKNLNPKMDKSAEEKTVSLPEGLDAELLGKVLANPEMVALLSSLAKILK